jgi:hypothetical protein
MLCLECERYELSRIVVSAFRGTPLNSISKALILKTMVEHSGSHTEVVYVNDFSDIRVGGLD